MEKNSLKNIAVSVFIWIMSGVMTIGLFLVSFSLVVFTYPFAPKRKFVHAQGFWWADGIIGFNPYWDFNIQGLENIDRTKTYVIVANHQSMADIVMAYKMRLQFKWIAKNSLFNIPIFGWTMSCMKYIRLKRGNYSSIRKVYHQASAWINQGISVLFFPEGTRSSGDFMNSFKSGAFKLAIKERVPILPIYIEGSRGVIPRGSWIFKRRATCTLIVLPEIDVKNFNSHDFEKLRDEAIRRISSAAKK